LVFWPRKERVHTSKREGSGIWGIRVNTKKKKKNEDNANSPKVADLQKKTVNYVADLKTAGKSWAKLLINGGEKSADLEEKESAGRRTDCYRSATCARAK